jgi:Ca2+-binding RTX toxin-like protein
VTVTGGDAVSVFGGDGNDTLTGSSGSDVLYGGLGADTLSSVATGERVTFELDGVLAAPADSGINIVIGAYNPGGDELTEGTQYVAGAGHDAVGSAIATFITTNLAAINAASGLQPLVSASYDANTDLLTLNYAPGADVADGSAVITETGADLGTFQISAPTSTVQGAGGGDDTYLYTAAAESTEAVRDSILNFDVNGLGGANDEIDISAFFTDGVDGDLDVAAEDTQLAGFTAARTNAGSQFALGRDAYVASDGTNGWLFVDANQSGAIDATDMVITLTGLSVASAAAFDFDNITSGVDGNVFVV